MQEANPTSMPNERQVRLKTLIMVVAMVACANCGDLLLKIGMTRIGAVQFSGGGLARAFVLTFLNPVIWSAIVCLLGFLFSYMTVLSWADFSYVMPSGAFGYAVITILAAIFLGETVSHQRWVGVVLICAGVLLVGQTKPQTTGEPL